MGTLPFFDLPQLRRYSVGQLHIRLSVGFSSKFRCQRRKIPMVTASPSTPASENAARLLQRYQRIREASLNLAGPLAVEDQVVQTMPEVSPTKWHLAHTSWFFEKFLLCAHQEGYQPRDQRFHYLFNSYYYSVGEMFSRANRGLLSRPTVSEILDYRRAVDDGVCAFIASRGDDPEIAFLVELGLNHEHQHQELMLTDIKHVFFTNPLGPAYREGDLFAPDEQTTEYEFIDQPGGQKFIGVEADDELAGFHFDNETPRHEVLVRDYAMGNRLITNGEFREFINNGGYSTASLWLADGWVEIREQSWHRPLYWSDDLRREFTLEGWREIDDSAPVTHVSFFEADAYATFAGARLPTESEWELCAKQYPVDGNLMAEPVTRSALHPLRLEAASHGVNQLYGDVWEWTASNYAAYPGFKPLDGSLGEYNGKFMCNQMAVRGGSCVTWREHIRATYRSYFYPKDRWQFLGFRLAKDV